MFCRKSVFGSSVPCDQPFCFVLQKTVFTLEEQTVKELCCEEWSKSKRIVQIFEVLTPDQGYLIHKTLFALKNRDWPPHHWCRCQTFSFSIPLALFPHPLCNFERYVIVIVRYLRKTTGEMRQSFVELSTNPERGRESTQWGRFIHDSPERTNHGNVHSRLVSPGGGGRRVVGRMDEVDLG